MEFQHLIRKPRGVREGAVERLFWPQAEVPKCADLRPVLARAEIGGNPNINPSIYAGVPHDLTMITMI